jgi:hypothetical protein
MECRAGKLQQAEADPSGLKALVMTKGWKDFVGA